MPNVATALMLVTRTLTCQPQHRDAAPHGLAVTGNPPSMRIWTATGFLADMRSNDAGSIKVGRDRREKTQ